VADRTVFQSDKTKPEDKTVLWEYKECGNDTNMDNINSVLTVLSAEGEIKKFKVVIYEFHISNKDNAVSAGFSL
jgi:hypothetical protein